MFISFQEQYIAIPKRVLIDETLSTTARLVYCYLISCGNGTCVKNIEIARALSISPITSKKCIQELTDKDWVKLVKGKSNQYCILSKVAEPVPRQTTSTGADADVVAKAKKKEKKEVNVEKELKNNKENLETISVNQIKKFKSFGEKITHVNLTEKDIEKLKKIYGEFEIKQMIVELENHFSNEKNHKDWIKFKNKSCFPLFSKNMWLYEKVKYRQGGKL